MGGCSCCKDELAGQVYTPRKQRWCTDLICLLFLLMTWTGMGALGYVCIDVKEDLLYDLYYPTDSYGQHCGRPGTIMADRPRVMYPDLDADITANYDLIVTHQWMTFFSTITKLCVAECPDGISLTNPTYYGGDAYPLDNASNLNVNAISPCGCTPEYWYSFRTEKYASRCFPTTSTFTGGTTVLCATPPCTNEALNATLGGTLECAALSARPDEVTTWEVCPSGATAAECALREDWCDFKVEQGSSWFYLPVDHSTENSDYTEQIATYASVVIGGFDGVLYAYQQVLGFGLGMSVGIGFVWIVLLWFFAGLIVWMLITFLLVSCCLLNIYLCSKAGWLEDVTDDLYNFTDFGAVVNSSLLAASSDDDLQIWYEVGAIASILCTILVLVCICAWRKCINRAIAIVRECTKVFRALPLLMLWPLLSIAFEIAFLGFGLLILFWIWDDEVWQLVYDKYGEVAGKSEITQEEQIALSAFALLASLWGLNFCRAISWSSMASAVGYWFIVDNAPDLGQAKRGRGCCCWGGTGLGLVRLLDATWTIVSKHLGSMAFGALIIATCQLIRIVLKLVEMSTQQAQQSNLLLKLVLKCAQCAMWCLQASIEYISYYGYVYVALEGGAFCRGCKSTFQLILKFPAQAAVNKTVQKLLSLLLGWSIPALCSVCAWYHLDNDDDYTAEGFSAVHAALAVFLGAWVVADGLTTTFSCCIDTIYLSAFVDMEANDPPKYMSNDLREAFGIDKAEEEVPAGASKLYKPVGDPQRNQVGPTGYDEPVPRSASGTRPGVPPLTTPQYGGAVSMAKVAVLVGPWLATRGFSGCVRRLGAALRTREKRPSVSHAIERPWLFSQWPPKLTISLRLAIQVRMTRPHQGRHANLHVDGHGASHGVCIWEVLSRVKVRTRVLSHTKSQKKITRPGQKAKKNTVLSSGSKYRARRTEPRPHLPPSHPTPIPEHPPHPSACFRPPGDTVLAHVARSAGKCITPTHLSGGRAP